VGGGANVNPFFCSFCFAQSKKEWGLHHFSGHKKMFCALKASRLRACAQGAAELS
jgi:hypothetical protein